MSEDTARKILKRARRIVVKVGSSTLTRNGKVRTRKFSDLSNQVATLVEDGRQVVLVSSGAIAVGSHRLSWTTPGRSIPAMQAAACTSNPVDAPATTSPASAPVYCAIRSPARRFSS